jgi:methionyl-tRNA synthetase
VIGKDILWFHAVYWPAMLFSLGLELPRKIVAHGWWTAEGKKMSKSVGNVIDVPRIRTIAEAHSLDAVRYYLLRAAPLGSDLDWSEADFGKAFNELANVVGNCLNRTIKMIGRYRGGVLPASGTLEQIDRDLIARGAALAGDLDRAYEAFSLQDAVMLPVELARATNGYIDATAPFSLAKDPSKEARLNTVLNLSAQAICKALLGLLPVLPEKAREGLEQLNATADGKRLEQLLSTELAPGHQFGEGKPLFPKLDR